MQSNGKKNVKWDERIVEKKRTRVYKHEAGDFFSREGVKLADETLDEIEREEKSSPIHKP